MIQALLLLTLLAFAGGPAAPAPQNNNSREFKPVTDQMLLNLNPEDWLMPSRTYDWQRFSPLNQINKQNVNQLRLAWSRGLAGGGLSGNINLGFVGVVYVG